MRIATFAAALAVAGCGSSEPVPSTPAAPTAPSASSAASAPSGPSSDPIAPASAAPAAPPPEVPAVLAADSAPPGIHPLAEDEKKELATKCKKLADAITASAKKDGGKHRSDEIVSEFLKAPPKLAGVDVPRCGDLMLRDLRAYLARSRESQAIFGLKRIVVGLAQAMDAKPPILCPSAPKVPADLASLASGSATTSASDWKAEGWQCARFDAQGPTLFQFELKTDAKSMRYEAIARGYPVPGEAPTELFLAGEAKDGKIEPSSAVMRRAAR